MKLANYLQLTRLPNFYQNSWPYFSSFINVKKNYLCFLTNLGNPKEKMKGFRASGKQFLLCVLSQFKLLL